MKLDDLLSHTREVKPDLASEIKRYIILLYQGWIGRAELYTSKKGI